MREKIKEKWEAYKEEVRRRRHAERVKGVDTGKVVLYLFLATVVILVLIFGWKYIMMFLALISGGI